MRAFLLIACLLCSCVSYEHTATSKSGNVEHDKLFALGGVHSQRGADGSSIATDEQTSFRDATVAATSIAGSLAAAAVRKAANASAATTTQQLNAQTAQTANAKIAADAAAAAEAAKVTTIPAGASVLTGGVILTAPK